MPVKIDKGLLLRVLSEKTGVPVSSLEFSEQTGGSINKAYKVRVTGQPRFFVKVNTIDPFPRLLEREQSGLQFLAKQKIIRVPGITGYHATGNHQFLILEWIEPGTKTESFWKLFGEQLAQLHKTVNSRFGYPEDNYMGALTQANDFSENWIDFFIDHRLRPQIQLARGTGLLLPEQILAFENLFRKLDVIFDTETPSLLHGDLWSGNFICDQNDHPVLIDPAVYFGHRSMDLGMTTLFGGFDKSFYESYHYHFPLAPNYSDQWDICNLYPLLIHLNLFGSGYYRDIATILKKFTG